MKPPYEVLLVRHGEAHCNTGGYLAADTCQGLTEMGRRQATFLARRLRYESDDDAPVVRLLCSPVRRAYETAHVVANTLGLEPQTQQQLRVPDLGPRAEGQTFETLRQRWPPDPAKPGRVLIDGGETWSQYLVRAHACLKTVLDTHPGGRIVIIGHNETISAALSLLLGVSSLGALTLHISNTGITRLVSVQEYLHVTVTTRRWALTAHNDATHLLNAESYVDSGVRKGIV